MGSRGFALFDTAIGRCGIVWTNSGIAGMQLPEASDADTRARLQGRCPGAAEMAPPLEVQRTIDSVIALLQGESSDLSTSKLDMDGLPAFHRRVYEVARSIRPGTTMSYGDVAKNLGSPGAARAVGQALGQNPFAIVVPCHRVLAATGKLGGFSAHGGVATKLKLLCIERGAARPSPSPTLFGGGQALPFDAGIAVQHLRSADPELGSLISTVGTCRMRLDNAPTTFEALAEAIVYQQLTAKAARAIFGKLRLLFPSPHEGLSPEHVLRATDDRLRSAGLSGSKALSLRDLARKTVANEIPPLRELEAMADEAVVSCLTRVRGIGRWTVQMLLMFRLGRPDVLPSDDYGLRKGFAVTFGTREVPAPREVELRGASWQPYRTIASWYLWRAAEADSV